MKSTRGLEVHLSVHLSLWPQVFESFCTYVTAIFITSPMPFTILKITFTCISTRKPLQIVFWLLCYLLSWHLSIHSIALLLMCFIFISKLFRAHMFYLPQLNLKSLRLGGMLPTTLFQMLFAVESSNILNLMFIKNFFVYFMCDWQVKLFSLQDFCSSRKELESTKYFVSSVRKKLATDILIYFVLCSGVKAGLTQGIQMPSLLFFLTFLFHSPIYFLSKIIEIGKCNVEIQQ